MPNSHQATGVIIMNKEKLVENVATKTGLTKKESRTAINATLESISEALINGEDRVQLIGFGTFQLRERKAHKGRNPQTGKEITIPTKQVVSFKPSTNLRKGVNK